MHKVECKILPKTKRLKQLIKEHGEEWSAISSVQPVMCFDNDLGVKVLSKLGHVRWVKYPEEIQFIS